MKKFFGKKLFGIIPMAAVIAVILVAAVALAALWISTTQTITQTITEPPPPPEYGTITAPDIPLQNLMAGGQSFASVFPNHVGVDLGPDGVGGHLWLELDEDILYAEYEVKLVCKASADEGIVPIGTTVIVDEVNWRTSIPLGAAGTYTFDQYIHLKTGPAWGEASTAFKIGISNVAAP